MSLFELLSLIIAIVNILVIAGGLIFTYRQISLTREQINFNAEQTKLLVESHFDNHEWNRRSVTQEVLLSMNMSGRMDDVIAFFLDQDRTSPIPRSEILERFKAEPELRRKTHTLLNFYETLARGIKYGVYDEEIVRNARHGSMKRAVLIFREYIDHWRTQGYSYWTEFEQLVNKWVSEDARQIGKPPLGQLNK